MNTHFARFGRAAVCASILLLSGSAARAAVLLPGGSVTPDILAGPAGTLVASTTQPLPAVGSITAAVVLNAGGTLDFYYQITNSLSVPAHDLARNSNDAFAVPVTFDTEVFYRLENGGLPIFTAGNAGATPLTADRGLDGLVVGFNFTAIGQPTATKIQPGETTRILVIRTNATEFTLGNSFVINGVISGAQTFAPTAVVPEPASLVLLSSAFAAAGYMARHRARRRKPGNA